MAEIEQFEIEACRGEIDRDVRHLVEKYRAIFDWNVPDIDQTAADGLILEEVPSAVNALKTNLLNPYAILRVTIGPPDAALKTFLEGWKPEHPVNPRQAMEREP